jgi:hypothetical protein
MNIQIDDLNYNNSSKGAVETEESNMEELTGDYVGISI